MKNQGQNITEFSIIIAVVVIVCIMVLTLLGGNIAQMLNLSQNKVDNFKPFGINYNKNTGARIYKSGELGGSSSKPIASCSGGICSVDYGDFVLNGVPEDFGEHVEAHGTSGGTNTIAQMLSQIADQLAAEGDVAGSQKFKDLSNLTFFMAAIEKETEKLATSCKSASDQGSCIFNKINSMTAADLGISLPANVQTLIPNFNPNSKIIDIIDYNTPSVFATGSIMPSHREIDPAGKAEKIFKEIIDENNPDPKITDTLKGTAIALMQNIDYLANYNRAQMRSCEHPTQPNNFITRDLLTGAQNTEEIVVTINNSDEILKPQTSATTNFDSLLLCAAGYNKTKGYSCK